MDSTRDTQTQSEGQVAATSLVSGISSKKEDTPKKGYPQTVKKGNSAAKFMKAVKVETLASAPPSTPPIRTSQRQIKRPKTDDELIDFESSSRGSTSKKIKTSLSSSATPKNPTTVSIHSVTLIRNVPYSGYFKRGLILVNLAIFFNVRQNLICHFHGQPQKICDLPNFDPSKYTYYTVLYAH